MVVRRVKRVCQCVIVLMFHSPCCSYLDVARLELLSFRHRFLVCLQLDSELLRNMLNGTIGNGNKSYANKPPTNGNGKWLCKCVAALTLLLFITFWCVIIFYASRRDQVLDVAVSHDYPLPDVPTRYSDNSRVPLLFHQMWKSERIPAKWRSAHEGCMALNSEYELILWTDEMIYNFIYRYYPWFYRIFLSYPYQIQRVDVARYFILYHYGGVYLDVDASQWPDDVRGFGYLLEPGENSPILGTLLCSGRTEHASINDDGNVRRLPKEDRQRLAQRAVTEYNRGD